MWYRRLPPVLVLLASQLAICRSASAQTDAVGLNTTDIYALRTMLGPTGEPTFPAGARHEKVSSAWKEISEPARDLLLREQDLAVVIVDSNGVWLWRSSGIQTLRALYGDKLQQKKADLEHLVAIIKDDWFQKLTRLRYESPLPPNRADFVDAFATMLTRADATAGATGEEKEWFRGIVGSEIQNLDSGARTALLLHPVEGKRFIEAVAVADTAKKRQLEAVDHALTSGAGKSIRLEDLAVQFPTGTEKKLANGRANVRVVGGKPLIEWTTPNGSVFVAAKKASPKLPSIDFTKSGIKKMMENDQADVFFSSHGTQSVLAVKAN